MSYFQNRFLNGKKKQRLLILSNSLPSSDKNNNFHNFQNPNFPKIIQTVLPEPNGIFDSSKIPIEEGIYGIQCVVTGETYVGETDNLQRRVLNGIGACRNNRTSDPVYTKLLIKWSFYGESKFAILIFEKGNDWTEKTVRLDMESRLITFYKNQNLSLNTAIYDRFQASKRTFSANSAEETRRRKGISKSRVGRPPTQMLQSPPTIRTNVPKSLKIDGVFYKSLLQASREKNLCRETIKKRCLSTDIEWENWVFES